MRDSYQLYTAMNNFPKNGQKPKLIDEAPEDSLMLVSNSEHMDSDLFLLWLKHFIGRQDHSKHVYATDFEQPHI